MITRKALADWIGTLDADDIVGIDDGGQRLVVLDTDAHFHVGGMPDDDDDDDDEDSIDESNGAVSRVPKLQPWERDEIQFPRLLAEIIAAGVSVKLWDTLLTEMDLTSDQLNELFDRAQRKWEEIKQPWQEVALTCAAPPGATPRTLLIEGIVSVGSGAQYWSNIEDELGSVEHGLARLAELKASQPEVSFRLIEELKHTDEI